MQSPNWDKCLCHVKDDATGILTPFSEISWREFEECAKRRSDEICLFMKDHWKDGP